jgi:hypothetical protein
MLEGWAEVERVGWRAGVLDQAPKWQRPLEPLFVVRPLRADEPARAP